MKNSVFLKIIFFEMLSKFFVIKYFDSLVTDSMLINFTRNPNLSDYVFFTSIDSFLSKYLLYVLLSNLISIVATGLILFLSLKDRDSKLAKIFIFIYGFLFITGISSTATEVVSYKEKGKLYLFKKGNFYFNKNMIKNAKDSGDYKFINALVSGTSIGDSEVLEIISKRPKQVELDLKKENLFDLSSENNKLLKCEIQKGVGEVLFDKNTGKCFFLNKVKKRGETQITLNSGAEDFKLVVYSY